MGGFDDWLEALAPGATDERDPVFPRALELEPLGVIGRGGTGVVYRARDPVLGREVAVKISRPEGGAAARESMLLEAQRTAQLQHPAIVPILRVLAADGLLCVVSTLAPQRSLHHALTEARDQDEAWDIDARLAALEWIASAFGVAHDAGVIHGDLHPHNVALGPSNVPVVLDWGGVTHQLGTLSGEPGWIAPERLKGGAPTRAADVYSLGLLLWAMVTLRQPRPRVPGETLGEYVARWARAAPPDTTGMPGDLAQLCVEALADAPEARPSAQVFRSSLAAVLSGRVQNDRRRADAHRLLARASDALHRYQQLRRRIVDERTVVVVQRAKVPGHAPVYQKRELWAADDRVSKLIFERAMGWVNATEAATRVLTLAPEGDVARPEAHRLLARLWWERMVEAEERHDAVEAAVCQHWVRHYDDGPLTGALTTPATLSLSCNAENAVARISRFVERGRVLVPEQTDSRPMPLAEVALQPGSWLVEVDAPGFASTPYPVCLDRLEHLHEALTLFTPAQIGDGWLHVPAGRFMLGGDPRARQPLDPCRPWLPDLFFTRTAVRSSEWKAFLDDIDPDQAAAHVPGESGFMGASGRRYWVHEGGEWRMPEGWNPDWPVFSVSYGDIVAYCAWRSAREGRLVRLPTEEEWEKASRGVDARSYPWGDHFDPTFAHMRQSQPGPPRPHPVADYPVDTSVYGLRDTAGGMRELTASHFDVGQLVIRGGTWGDDADDLRCANRAGLQPDFRYSFISFRLVSESPRPTSSEAG